MPGYLGNDPAGSATKIARQTYTTSGAATTDFTFTSGYDVGYLDVYVNGERQTKGKNFTASDGSTFRVLNGGVGTGSTVEAIAYKTFNLATVDFDDLGNTGNLTLSGDISAVNATFSGDVSIGGTLTYEDVTNIDSVGIVTARSGIEFGASGVGGTVTAVGNATFTGIVTAASFVGDGTGLTGVASTDNINTSTLAQFTGGVGIADSIFHIGDDNTAIRFPAADTFTVETAGDERIRVTSAGRVGIGTDDPQQDVQIDSSTETTLSLYEGGQKFGALQVQGSSNFGTILYSYNGNPLVFSTNSGTGFDRALTIDTSQRLLIGATTTRGTHGGGDAQLQIEGTNTATAGMSITRTSADAGSPTFSFGKTRNGSALSDGDDVGVIYWQGDDGTDLATALCSIKGEVDGSVSGNAVPGRITFNTATTSTNLSERFRISSDGNLRHSCSGGETIFEMQRTDSNTTGAVGTINFLASDDHSVASMGAMGDGDNEGAHIVFRTTSAAANESPYNAATPERVRINSSGDLIVDAGGDAQDIQIKSHSANSGHGLIYMRGNASNERSTIRLNHFGHSDWNIAAGGTGNGEFSITSTDQGTDGIKLNSDGDLLPAADNSLDLGSTSLRWANIYSADLQLSNEGSSNDVDGTWGQYTIQEGENDLFLLNRRNGKKYKFMLQEVD
jgi:hypothetical protein